MRDISRICAGPWRAPVRKPVPRSKGTPTSAMSTFVGSFTRGVRMKVAASAKRGMTAALSGCSGGFGRRVGHGGTPRGAGLLVEPESASGARQVNAMGLERMPRHDLLRAHHEPSRGNHAAHRSRIRAHHRHRRRRHRRRQLGRLLSRPRLRRPRHRHARRRRGVRPRLHREGSGRRWSASVSHPAPTRSDGRSTARPPRRRPARISCRRACSSAWS